MGNRFLRILIGALLLGGCGSRVHLVYVDRDREVLKAPGKQICERTYSQFDGTFWTDYYAAPCEVYLKQRVKPIYSYDPETGKNIPKGKMN